MTRTILLAATFTATLLATTACTPPPPDLTGAGGQGGTGPATTSSASTATGPDPSSTTSSATAGGSDAGLDAPVDPCANNPDPECASCFDNRLNGGETGVDCGGNYNGQNFTGCPPCPDGNYCLEDADCLSAHCDSTLFPGNFGFCSPNPKPDPNAPCDTPPALPPDNHPFLCPYTDPPLPLQSCNADPTTGPVETCCLVHPQDPLNNGPSTCMPSGQPCPNLGTAQLRCLSNDHCSPDLPVCVTSPQWTTLDYTDHCNPRLRTPFTNCVGPQDIPPASLLLCDTNADCFGFAPNCAPFSLLGLAVGVCRP